MTAGDSIPSLKIQDLCVCVCVCVCVSVSVSVFVFVLVCVLCVCVRVPDVGRCEVQNSGGGWNVARL